MASSLEPGPPSLASYSILAFDLYSTLIDREAGIFEALLDSLDEFPDDFDMRADMTEYIKYRLLSRFEWQQEVCQKEHPMLTYQVELEQAHYRLMAQDLKIQDMSLQHARDFSESVFSWPAASDATTALSQLQQLGYKIVLVSNLETSIIAHAIRDALQGFKVDWVYSGNNIMTYKPDAKSLSDIVQHIERDLHTTRDKILYVSSSLRENLLPAQTLGLTTAGIRRGVYDAYQVRKASDDIANMSLAGKEWLDDGYDFTTLSDFVKQCQAHCSQAR